MIIQIWIEIIRICIKSSKQLNSKTVRQLFWWWDEQE